MSTDTTRTARTAFGNEMSHELWLRNQGLADNGVGLDALVAPYFGQDLAGLT